MTDILWTEEAETAYEEGRKENRKFLEKLARCTLPEEECGDGDVDEFLAEMSDERLFGEYHAFMEFVREARKLVSVGG